MFPLGEEGVKTHQGQQMGGRISGMWVLSSAGSGLERLEGEVVPGNDQPGPRGAGVQQGEVGGLCGRRGAAAPGVGGAGAQASGWGAGEPVLRMRGGFC